MISDADYDERRMPNSRNKGRKKVFFYVFLEVQQYLTELLKLVLIPCYYAKIFNGNGNDSTKEWNEIEN